MKQHRNNQKIINWHKPVQPGAMKRRYMRNRYEDLAATTESWTDDDENYGHDCCYDDYWDYFNPSDEYDHLLTDVVCLIGESWPPRRLRPPFALPLLFGPSTDFVPTTFSCPSRGRHEDTQQSGDLAARLVAFLSNAKRGHESGRWPSPAFAAGFLTACRTAHQQIELLWQQLSQVRAEARMPLGMAMAFSPFWIRTPQQWTPPKTASPARMIVSFIDHLFIQYPVPRFLYSDWTSDSGTPHVKWLCWFILLGQGGSLHKAAGRLGWDVPKALTGLLDKVPEDLHPLEGCMFAEIKRLGGCEVEFRRLTGNPAFVIDPTCGQDRSARIVFWRETVKWLVRYRDELSDYTSGRVLNWAMHMFTELEMAGRAFSWRGRTPASTLAATEEYHRKLDTPYVRYRWMKHGWDWSQQGEEEWSVQELASGQELCEESRAMHHCVASYGARCCNDYSAIFSVRKHGTRVLTVEVSPESKQIVQVRGACNRPPTPAEQAIVDRWWRQVVRVP